MRLLSGDMLATTRNKATWNSTIQSPPIKLLERLSRKQRLKDGHPSAQKSPWRANALMQLCPMNRPAGIGRTSHRKTSPT